MFSPTQDRLARFPREGRNHQEDFQPFFSAVKSTAKTITPGLDPNGLLGWITPAAEYLLLVNPAPAGPFALLVHPGPIPQAANAFPAWKYQMDCYLAQQLAMVNLTKIVLAALDDISIALVRGDALLENVTLPVIIARLVAAYSVASPADLVANHAVLLGFFSPPANMPAHLLMHVNAHYFATCNGQPYSVAAKIQLLRASIAGCGLFSTALHIWDAAHPTVALQTWDSLAQAITHAAASLAASSAASQGFALSATSAAAVPVNSPMDELAAENRALRLALSVQSSGRSRGGGGGAAAASAAATGTGSGNSRGPPTLTPHRKGRGLFCWSHPTQGHLGSGCLDPLPGHQKTATWSDRMNSPCH